MATWPEVDEVVQLLDIGDDQGTVDHLQHALDSAIEQVKKDVGNWDDDSDTPTESQRQAALRAVQVLRVNAPDDGWRTLRADRIYQGLIFGTRRRFGIS
jgi:hypothetical protein